MTDVCNYHLPTYKHCHTTFLKEIIAGKKRAFKKHEIKGFCVPKHDEISVKAMLPDALKLLGVATFLPGNDQYRPKIERDFFFGIFGPLYPEYFAEILRVSNRARNTEERDKEEELIEISPQFFEEMQLQPVLSK